MFRAVWTRAGQAWQGRRSTERMRRFRERGDVEGPQAESIEQDGREKCSIEDLRLFTRRTAASMARASRFACRVALGAVVGLLAELVERACFPSMGE